MCGSGFEGSVGCALVCYSRNLESLVGCYRDFESLVGYRRNFESLLGCVLAGGILAGGILAVCVLAGYVLVDCILVGYVLALLVEQDVKHYLQGCPKYHCREYMVERRKGSWRVRRPEGSSCTHSNYPL